MKKSMKSQAEELMTTLDRDVQEIEDKGLAIPREVNTQAETILDKIFGTIKEVDLQAAEKRVQYLRDKYPYESDPELVQRLIRSKCQQTGAIGAVTSGAGLIPGVGTAAAMTLGVAADIGATFKLQSELVLEIATVYDYPLSETEKQRIVMIITGISTGTTTLAFRTGEKVALRAGERFAGKAVLKALPVLGVIASAGTNVMSTYVIGQRADAYFRLGPESVGSWTDSLRAITGVDERTIGQWLVESGKSTGTMITDTVSTSKSALNTGVTTGKAVISSSVNRASEVGKTVGEAIATIGYVPMVGYEKMRHLFWPDDHSGEKIVEGKILSMFEIDLNEAIYPLTFTPVFRDYIWGGRNLDTVVGRVIPDGIVAESWDISGFPSSPTTVNYGPLAGKTLPQIVNILGLNLVGQHSEAMLRRGLFPLLIKLIDANKRLSVQVHPNDAYAGEHENGHLGKTEMWYILHAKPNAYMIYGLTADVTRERFIEAIENEQLEPYLHKLPVKVGDTVFVPAGTVHAVMDGIILAEIQQNADTTYRVYDWNRVDTDGSSRPLHIEKAMDVINFSQIEPGLCELEFIEGQNGFRRDMVVTCQHFSVERFTFEAGGSFRCRCDGSTFEIWGVMSGAGQVMSAGGLLELLAVQFTLLPAMLGDFEIRATAPGEWLRIYVPA
jgi:mannose-6-phosphate isomerase